MLIIILIILFQAILLKIYNTTNYISILTVYINLLLLLLFSYTLSKYNYNIKEIIIPIVIFSFINSILGLIQFKTGKLFINFKDQEALIRSYSTVKRVSGFIIGDNGAGNLGAILFPILLYNYNNKKNLINLLVLVLNILFTILTFTRIGYLAIIIEIMIYFLYKNKFNNIKNIILFITKIIIIYFCIICFYKFAYNKFYQILFIDRGDTVTGRFLQFRYALMAFITKPLSGIGTGQYNEYIVNNLFLFDPCVIHSQLLNTLVEGGLLIFIPFILFNIFIILKLIKKYKMKNEFIYIIMLIIGNLIATNFNPNQYYDINIYIYYTILFLFLFENKVDFKNKTKDSFYN
ncbi:O-antigen ligase family protein [Caloramator sp. E03]|uniref:O-antigen ligase family protein n=1 Tax=Caloramator sp. E03 TaxID=2576307 RepID=UPI00111046F0|nr:O-antigen ligase family protein [Caloramator sp. E03]QCX34378.1 O-antigen ligase family protein [Caloramator sp. E03]